MVRGDHRVLFHRVPTAPDQLTLNLPEEKRKIRRLQARLHLYAQPCSIHVVFRHLRQASSATPNPLSLGIFIIYCFKPSTTTTKTIHLGASWEDYHISHPFLVPSELPGGSGSGQENCLTPILFQIPYLRGTQQEIIGQRLRIQFLLSYIGS